MPARILLVDNLESNLELGRILLEARGYQVVTAKHAEDALAFLKQKSDTINLIVSDINMPDKDGFDFIKEVKANPVLAKIAFVFLTATYWTDSVKKEGLKLGADKFIFRPADPRAIVTEIEEVIPESLRGDKPLPDAKLD